MNYQVFQRFEGQNVEVRASDRNHTGTLELDIHNNVVVLTTTSEYSARRHGPVVIDIAAISSIRVILPEPPESEDEDSGDIMMKDEA